ncbi:hypothetical protein SGRA_1792 [Saprospira grandis str. Lewin]|uniref:Uncharacterized protein n=1 Tax=Saprospira grandis (strain Lewin) TaxID=984262 RepID=H6KZD7_SAPGL|nr:hypothetical protein SGRA_1792 [Saprospira grandis str. Lewin]
MFIFASIFRGLLGQIEQKNPRKKRLLRERKKENYLHKNLFNQR